MGRWAQAARRGGGATPEGPSLPVAPQLSEYGYTGSTYGVGWNPLTYPTFSFEQYGFDGGDWILINEGDVDGYGGYYEWETAGYGAATRIRGRFLNEAGNGPWSDWLTSET